MTILDWMKSGGVPPDQRPPPDPNLQEEEDYEESDEEENDSEEDDEEEGELNSDDEELPDAEQINEDQMNPSADSPDAPTENPTETPIEVPMEVPVDTQFETGFGTAYPPAGPNRGKMSKTDQKHGGPVRSRMANLFYDYEIPYKSTSKVDPMDKYSDAGTRIAVKISKEQLDELAKLSVMGNLISLKAVEGGYEVVYDADAMVDILNSMKHELSSQSSKINNGGEGNMKENDKGLEKEEVVKNNGVTGDMDFGGKLTEEKVGMGSNPVKEKKEMEKGKEIANDELRVNQEQHENRIQGIEFLTKNWVVKEDSHKSGGFGSYAQVLENKLSIQPSLEYILRSKDKKNGEVELPIKDLMMGSMPYHSTMVGFFCWKQIGLSYG